MSGLVRWKWWGLAELLIDSEEDRTLRAVLVGMLLGADGEPPFSTAP